MPENLPRVPSYSFSDVFPWSSHWNAPRGIFFSQLDRTKLCPFCSKLMRKVESISGKCTPDDYVVICDICGFWFGHGWKEWYMGPHQECGAVGLLTYNQLDDLEMPTDSLLSFLNENPKWITSVNPYKAEDLVCRLLSDAFGWEVMHLGGRRDKGIDALAITTNRRRIIVQVKWRQNRERAESVSVIRELAGTLVARGIPNGLLVTTSDRISPDAKLEIDTLRTRRIFGLGRIEIEWKTYADVLDMLEISSVTVDERKRVPFENRDHGGFYIFDGRGIWDPNWNHIASEQEREKLMAGDPYHILASAPVSQ